MGSVLSWIYSICPSGFKQTKKKRKNRQNQREKRRKRREAKRREAAWEAAIDRVENSQLQQLAVRLGCDTWEEVQPTLNDQVIAPSEELARALLDQLRCPVCLRIAHDPVETDCCSHVLCRVCASKVIERNSGCPICRKTLIHITNSHFPSRLIGACPGKCPFCELIMPQTCLEDHKEICPEALYACSICLELIPTKDIEIHDIRNHSEYKREFDSLDSSLEDFDDLVDHLEQIHRPDYPPGE